MRGLVANGVSSSGDVRNGMLGSRARPVVCRDPVPGRLCGLALSTSLCSLLTSCAVCSRDEETTRGGVIVVDGSGLCWIRGDGSCWSRCMPLSDEPEDDAAEAEEEPEEATRLKASRLAPSDGLAQ